MTELATLSHRQRLLPCLGKPLAYTFSSSLITVASSVTTISAPILLTPTQFASFTLLTTVFMYTADFDIGLARLADRDLSTRQPKHSLDEFVVARFVICLLLCLGTIIAAVYFGALLAIAGIAGAMFMLTNGPFSYYRARSQIYDFTLTGMMIGFGMSLPRLAGLLVGGVAGTLLALLMWYSAISLIVNKPYLAMLTASKELYRCRILKDAIPLFSFSYLWFVYLLSNRWFSWSVSSAHDTGLFAFGATLLYIGVGSMAGIGQVYYPKHLTGTAPHRLARELLWVAAVIVIGITVGQVFCRYGLPLMFPHFAAASLSSAVILLTGLPLCLAAWITPIVIARSSRPWCHSSSIFGTSLVVLYASIYYSASYGIVGQSLACLPSAVLLLFGELLLLRRMGFISRDDIVSLAVALILGLSFCGAVVYALS